MKDLISLHGGEKGIIHRSSDIPEGIAGSLEPFVTKNPVLVDEDDEKIEAVPSLWPIVKIVRVGLQAKILSRGLVIADLPGKLPCRSARLILFNSVLSLALSDSNRVRVKTTK